MSEDRDTEQVSSTWLAQLRHEHGIYGGECIRLQKELDSSKRMFENAVMTIVTIGEAAGVRGEDQQNGHLEIVEAINKIKGRRAVYKAKAAELERELEVWRSGPSCWSCGDSGQVHSLDGEWRGECNCQGAVDARTIAALEGQVKVLQSDVNSWQSGYDKGRTDGSKHRQAELAALKAQEPVAHKPQTCDGKRCGWCKEGAEPCHYAAPVSEAKAQGVTDEQAAFEAAVAAVNERGWSTSTDLARQIWDAARLNAAPVQQVSVPQCVFDWFEAKQAHVNAVDAYNARLAFVREHMPFGTSVDPEYQIMEEAARKASRLVWPMFNGLRDLAAAPAALVSDGWISVSERLPLADGQYWCFFSEEHPSTLKQRVCIFIERQQQFCDSTVTHWMPLPAAPSAHRSQGVPSAKS